MIKHAAAFLLGCLLILLGATPAVAGKVTYIYTDQQGSPLIEADAQGNVLQRFDYKPYGGASDLWAPPDGPGYTGHVNDPETDLIYMQARYQDPAVGRFLSVDPAEPEAGDVFAFNRYAYASNDPYKFTDPDGRQSCCDSGTVSDQSQNPQQARMQGVREVGAVGERLNGINPGDPRERVQSRTKTAAYRVVDKSSKMEIREVKNVGRLDRITNQMRDLVAEAKASARDLIYSVRENTTAGKSVTEYFGANGIKVDPNLPVLEKQPTLRQLETMPMRGAMPEQVPMPLVRPVIEPLIIP